MDSQGRRNCWGLYRIVFLFYLASITGPCSSAAPTERCDRSVSTWGSTGMHVTVCVRAWSPTSLEVTWSPQSGSSRSDIGQVKSWILTVAASEDRRRVVSFLTLESTVSRHVVSPLSPNTQYFIFLDSVDVNDWYVTMTSKPLAVRTLATGESRTTPAVETTTRSRSKVKPTRSPDEHRRIGEGRREGGLRPTPSQTIPKEEEKTRRNGRGSVESTSRNGGGWTTFTRIPDTDSRRGAETSGGADGQRRRNEEREQTGQESSREGDGRARTRGQNRRTKVLTTETPRKTTKNKAEPFTTRSSYGRKGSRQTRKPTGKEQRRREERVSERRESIVRRTSAPYIPRRPNKPYTVSTSRKTGVFSRSTSAITTDTTTQSNIDSNENSSGVDLGKPGSQSENRDSEDAGSRLLWWVLVTSGAGSGLFLVLVMITLLTKRRQRKCSSFECPHLEQELSQTSRSSSKINNVIADTAKPDMANKLDPKINVRKISENGYTRSPSVPRSLPLPPIIVSGNSVETSASGNIGASSKLGRLETNSIPDRQREESVYATLGDDLLAPDPARVVSIISWGSEFDILEESKADVYGNLSTSKSLEKVYGNLDLTYGNMSSSTAAATSQPQPSTLPKLTTTTTTTNTPSEPEKVQSPHPYAVPRRQTSTSSVPNFTAPAPPPLTSPTLPPELLSHLKTLPQSIASQLQQQQQQQQEQPQLPGLLPGLDLPKEKLQQLVMLLLSNSAETAAADETSTSPSQSSNAGNSTDQPSSPAYLVPKNPFFRKT